MIRKLLDYVLIAEANAGSFIILFCLLLLGTILLMRSHKGLNAKMLWWYLCVLFYLTFLNRQVGFAVEVRLRLHLGNPFGDWSEKVQFVYAFLNVLLFVPFGWLLMKMHWSKRVTKTLGVCLLATLAIEIGQYLTTRGYFELTDIVCNFVGGILGIGAVLLTEKLLGQ